MAEAMRQAMNAYLESLKETIRDAWKTVAALPDPDARFRHGLGFGWVFQTICDYPPESARFCSVPTPEEISEAEIVFEWLAWLRRQPAPEGGEFSLNRIAVWALGQQPIWKMAQREGCSEKTVHNRIDRSVAAIFTEFVAESIDERVEVETVEEFEPRRDRIRGFTPSPERPMAGPLEDAGRVFIAGVGMMYRGKSYRSSYDVPGKSCRKRRG